jgi:peptidoglycan/LPS O-acetylase OafA/YrhL
MNPAFSVYLDAVRFIAAMLVFIWHLENIFRFQMPAARLGHEAVIAFFVLSGYVIAYVTSERERTLKDYIIARAARIYSVAVPTIVLSIAFDLVGHAFNPLPYAGYWAYDQAPVRILSSLLFTNEIWALSIQCFTNAPYWSLNYEVWYYVGFAALAYLKGLRAWMVFLLVGAVIGPKVLLMMPIWWLGVYLQRSKRLAAPPTWVGWVSLVGSVTGILFYHYAALDVWGESVGDGIRSLGFPIELGNSKLFLSDYVLAIFIGMHFLAIRTLCLNRPAALNTVAAPIRFLASTTFTLYLLHLPVMLFFTALLCDGPPKPEDAWRVGAATFVFTFAAGLVIENKKSLWKRWLTVAYEAIETRWRSLTSSRDSSPA